MIKEIKIKTNKKEEMVDINGRLEKFLEETKVKDGLLSIYVKHATAAIIINENHDPNVCVDILNLLKKLIPDSIWLHDKIDNNASAHIKACILGPSEVIPVKNGKLQLGQWQSPMLVELDGPRERTIILQLIG